MRVPDVFGASFGSLLSQRGLTKIKSRIQRPPSGGLFVWLVTPLFAGGISTNARCLRRVQSTDIEVFAS